jgi:type IV pilus modification protein PilV
MKMIKKLQSGVMLIEALIGILIFSIGILSLVALQAASVTATADAQYRVEAVNLANQMLGQIWAAVDRTNDTSLQNSLLAFSHQTTDDDDDSCNFSGDESGNSMVTRWRNLIVTGNAAGTGTRPMLPGTTNTDQQIDVNIGAGNQVVITVCWRAPSDSVTRRHVLVANVN